MKRLPTLALILFAGILLAQTGQDLYQRVLASRFIGKWKGHLHLDKVPDEFPNDYDGTVEAKWTIGMHVEAVIKVDPPRNDLKRFEARAILGSRDGSEVDGTPNHSISSVLYWDGDSGYLPMNGPMKNGRVIAEGDRVPKDPNGGRWKANVEFKSRDEIDVYLMLGASSDPTAPENRVSYIRLTREH